MAQLYFKFGAMGSSKTANALMARFNYEERGQETLLVKPRLDTRDGDHMVYSRIGLKHPCIYFDEMREMSETELQTYACIIIDEAQFLTKDEVYYLVHLVDDCSIPVICYGLRADFNGDLFPGSYHLLVLAVKPRLDTRDGDHMVYSRIGLKHPCIYFDEMREMSETELQTYACIIIDEAQFLTKDEVYYLVHLVDDCSIPVICYGLRADFKGDLFPGSYHLLVLADKLEEVKTICWCGKKAAFNARFDENGHVVKEGAQVVLGANDKYIGLCRRHWMAGDLGPDFDIHKV